jgi:hypothetical protein
VPALMDANKNTGAKAPRFTIDNPVPVEKEIIKKTLK